MRDAIGQEKAQLSADVCYQALPTYVNRNRGLKFSHWWPLEHDH